MKKMILVTSPPACGKTYISKQLARNLKHVVYLDKDTLIPLSNRVFAAAHEPVNRSSPFFEENIRDYEYETIVDIGVEALEYDDIVLINAPFTREIRDDAYIAGLRKELDRITQIRNEKRRRQAADDFRSRIASLGFLDPACGSGNFLTETFLSLRRMENEALRLVHESNMSKLDPETGKPLKRADGKVLKGPAYHAPDLGHVVRSVPVTLN